MYDVPWSYNRESTVYCEMQYLTVHSVVVYLYLYLYPS